jgi:hypothetical protein
MMIALFFLYLILAICFGVLIFQLDDFTPTGRIMVPVVGGIFWPLLTLIFVAIAIAAVLSDRVLPIRHGDNE